MGDNFRENTASMRRALGKPGAVAFILAVDFLLAAGIVAIYPVTYQGVDCGSWAASQDDSAKSADAQQDLRISQDQLGAALRGDSFSLQATDSTDAVEGCNDARGGMATPVTILVVLAVVSLVVGILRRYQPPSRGEPATD
ncbi:hypothetical protein [Williamsia serinedens]|nr:hypothetical protein [Williamsia serinedens]